MQGGVVDDGYKIHADQDEGHEYKEDAIVLVHFQRKFLLGFHGDWIVSQMRLRAIARADSVRKDSVRFPEGTMAAGDGDPYTGDKLNKLSVRTVTTEPMTEARSK